MEGDATEGEETFWEGGVAENACWRSCEKPAELFDPTPRREEERERYWLKVKLSMVLSMGTSTPSSSSHRV